jgi:hypothetical protein
MEVWLPPFGQVTFEEVAMHDYPVRSPAPIDAADLIRLGELAALAEADLFSRKPNWSGRYAGRLLCRALCQGGALQYVDGITGVKDFDVWSFYSEADHGPFPARWRGTADFGPSKFGRFPDDPPAFQGRRVDLIGRSLREPLDADPVEVLRRYLTSTKTTSARKLADKAVVLIEPADFLGVVVWPESASREIVADPPD